MHRLQVGPGLRMERLGVPAMTDQTFRRDVPTADHGWVLVTSTHEGIRLSPDVGTTTHILTPAQAASLADALTTAAHHQTLVIRRDQP